MQFLFMRSTRYIPRSICYTFVFGHIPISVTVLSKFHFPLSPWQLYKVSKNNNGKLFLVNNSIQHQIFLQSRAQVSSEITRGRYKAKAITSTICILYVYFFPIFSSFDYNMLHISSLSLLTSRILAINLTPIKFFSKKNTWLLVVSREKHI